MSDHNIERSLARAAKGNVTKFFSLKMITFEGDRAEFNVDIPDTCLNPLGTVQGGMVASILDEATSLTVNIYSEDKMLPNSTDIHITFHRALKKGTAKVQTKIIKYGKNIVSVEGKAFSEVGKLAATVLYTVILKSLV